MPYFEYGSKKVFYEKSGNGMPLILLHGNSVSLKMFANILDLYKNDYKIVLIDFLGHGRSDRLKEFPIDFWYDEALQVIRLLELKEFSKADIIGTSGGALVALNIALERPDLVNRLIADSFEGEKSLDSFANNVSIDRKNAKNVQRAREFWSFNHGEDWESVVDNDTQAIIQHHQKIGQFFHRNLSTIKVPTLLIGSLEDEYMTCIDKIYTELLTKIPHGDKHIFQSGAHPAMISNSQEFLKIAKAFLNQAEQI